MLTYAPLRAVIVCVDYSDLLEITLAYNRHHFDSVCVVTSFNDPKTIACAYKHNAMVYRTNAFYTDGAAFNKFRALEEGLDYFGRYGWMCILDADVLWPKHIDWTFSPKPNAAHMPSVNPMYEGYIYTPLRRMCEELNHIPQEPYWKQYPLAIQQTEWAGYTQIFHAYDVHLPETPWHETNWRHAGGADSFFQRLWPAENKLRPPFECLHIGPAGKNWCGRVTPLVDGTILPESSERAALLAGFIAVRNRTRSFEAEKL